MRLLLRWGCDVLWRAGLSVANQSCSRLKARNPKEYIATYLTTMKRAISITLLLALVCLAFSPLAALARQSHPAACPRVVSQHHCHNAQAVNGEQAFQAKPKDCPMRCCLTVRSGAVYALAPRVLLTAASSTLLEPAAEKSAPSLAEALIACERGPPLA
jgi:hypothetical protein